MFMISKKSKVILLTFFTLVILSLSVVSASDKADADILNHTDIHQDISAANTTDISLPNDNCTGLKQTAGAKDPSNNGNQNTTQNINTTSAKNNKTDYHSVELCLVKNLVNSYGNYSLNELASMYDVDSTCIKNILQLVRCGAYGDDLKKSIDEKDYTLMTQIKSLNSCQIDFSQLDTKRINRNPGFKEDIAEKIIEMYGSYSLKEMTDKLENLNVKKSDILLILYHIKTNNGITGYVKKLHDTYIKKESYLTTTLPKLQSRLIKTDAIDYSSPDSNARDIIFRNITAYGMKNKYITYVVDSKGKPITSGQVLFFLNQNLTYICPVDEYGEATFTIQDVFKTFGQYTITCIYSNIVKHDNITVENITLNEISGIKAIFEGVKIYNPEDLYKIKFLSTDTTKNITGFQVFFSINDQIIGMDTIDSNGFASCIIDEDVNETLNSSNCVMKCEIIDEVLKESFIINEQITIGTRSIPAVSKGSLLPKWRDIDFELCDDGYHAYIDKNTYQLINFDGSSFIVHREYISNAQQLKNLFEKLSKTEVQWDIITIDLIPTVYDIDFYCYSDREWDYACKFNYGQLIINGNGATLKGNENINFMHIGNDANVVLQNLTLKLYRHCFYNYGFCHCSNVKFQDNTAHKLDVKIGGSGAVIHNFNIAEFDDCDFINNNAKFFVGLWYKHMEGGILFAEPYSTTYFYHSRHSENQVFNDSIFACKYSSVFFIPRDCPGESRWTWDHLICESFYHPLATLTMIRSDENIIEDYKNNVYSPYVFNCTNSKELHNALSILNNAGFKGSEVIINLVNTTYSYDIETEFNENWLREYDGGILTDWNNDPYRDFHKGNRYLLNTGGFIPITINGNGAHIKITNNKADNDYHFAFIGKNGQLTLNNLSLSSFNTAFINCKGSLICNNCTISNNKIEHGYGDEGGVLKSYGGSSIFINCTMKNNRGLDGTDFAYAVENSYMELENCTISQHYNIYATLKDSAIKCSEDLYKNHISATSTRFIGNTTKEEVAYYIINSTQDFNNITASNLAEITFIDFNCNCSINLDKITSNGGIIHLTSHGFNVKINSGLNIGKNDYICLDGFTIDNKHITNNGGLTLLNCNLINYNSKTMFTNKGQATLTHCLISNNKCDNVFENNGELQLINSTIKNNKASDYGIVYNNEGTIFCINDIFTSNTGDDIYNFRTPNCAVINITFDTITFKDPLSALQLDLIMTGCLILTAGITGGAGYAFGAVYGPGFGLIFSQITGAVAGAGIGLAYGAIESSTLHDYSHLFSYVETFANIGYSAATAGCLLGITKYFIKYPQAQKMYSKKIQVKKEIPKAKTGINQVKIGFKTYIVDVPENLKVTTKQLKEITQDALVKARIKDGTKYFSGNRINTIKLGVNENNEVTAQFKFDNLLKKITITTDFIAPQKN